MTPLGVGPSGALGTTDGAGKGSAAGRGAGACGAGTGAMGGGAGGGASRGRDAHASANHSAQIDANCTERARWCKGLAARFRPTSARMDLHPQPSAHRVSWPGKSGSAREIALVHSHGEVLGNATTALSGTSSTSAISRSKPSALPAAGGMPSTNAAMKS